MLSSEVRNRLIQEIAGELPKELDLSRIPGGEFIDRFHFPLVFTDPVTGNTYTDRLDYFEIARRDSTREDGWAIVKHGHCLAVRGKKIGWCYERLPSNRTDSFKTTTRFTLDQAYQLLRSLPFDDPVKYRKIPYWT